MKFEIHGTTESADTNPKRTWDWIEDGTELSKAKRTAMRISKLKMWHEIELRGYDDKGELTHHSYWRNGKLEIDMSV